MARPSTYETEIKDKLILVQGWARDGLSNEQIAKNLGINISTLYKYQNLYDEFREALRKGKEVVDREVENALLKRAKGYTYVESKTVTNPDGTVIETKTVKEVAPDPTAMIFWLKNRKPESFRDRQDINMNADVTYTVAPNNLLSPEED